MVTRKEVDAAKTAEESARKALKVARSYLESLQEQRASELHNIKVGDRVVDGKGRHGIVVRLEARWDFDAKPWVVAKRIKKDGSQGEQEIQMLDGWEIAS